MHQMEFGRRTFLRAFLGFGLVLVLVSGVGYRYRQSLLRRYLRLRLDESSDAGELSEQELQVIKALFEVISPKPAPPTETLVEFVNLRTSSAKGFYREYRDAAAMLESAAGERFGRNFASLGTESRERILGKILARRSSVPVASEAEPPTLLQTIEVIFQILFFRPESRFKEFVFLDLLRFYWSSSAGWAAVGYNSHPGVPSAFRAYTLPPAQKTITSL
jgi:hypothetical protein